ncbi:aldolase/citrate lyase family protein [Blastococcus sp. CT_GayMR20]|uniref:HpcH/HpaI aldolase family protein n=1 Tax=Blastococcus sp. CT_GayMR20 TaxID=2559609 RepID=UPI001ADDDCAA|nr:aldolase/citrate lyase family protein [Blastococcus sp. CT_GayMR20]
MTPAAGEKSFKRRLDGRGTQIGMWACSGSAVVTEICAGAGFDWLIVDAEHSPNDVASIQAQLQVAEAYPPAVVVRPPVGEAVILKQYLDVGVRNLLMPMVESAAQARELVRFVTYPPRGIRGLGAGLARASQWGRDTDYLAKADETITVIVLIESMRGVDAAADIAAVEGVDGVLIGPSDLAASMGLLGMQGDPAVVTAVERCIRAVQSVGKPVGVNAFDEKLARQYIGAGVDFISVAADVSVLARGTEQVAARYAPGSAT